MTWARQGRWWVLVAAVVTAALTARLGVWQLDRARQKIDRQQQLEQRGALPPLPAAELALDEAGAAAQHFRRTTLQGRWMVERTLFLDNRQMNGRQGFFVVTPLLLPDGDAVLVQRGWVPRNFEDRSRLPAVPTATGQVLVAGRMAPPPAKLFELGQAELGPIRQNLDLPALAREFRVRLRPWSLQQLAPDQAVPAADGGAPLAPPADGLSRQWAAPALDVGKHHGYAFQWFALSALTTGLYVWFQLIRPRVARRTKTSR
ncbi:MAG: transmembrane cytochrome oxidase [Burkholderiales bacterium PBB5]|nr:MAG: transmembrane cytochrome oxidase [Burkholderiales bacterium PBB5]